ASKEIEDRLRGILTRDKVGVKNGFMVALNGDLNRLLGDYFELSVCGDVKVEQNGDGEYEVEFCAKASRIKSFDTTADLSSR
ncbi:MAG: hypothetical protein RR405_05870, partial [Clostridia bacterium]